MKYKILALIWMINPVLVNGNPLIFSDPVDPIYPLFSFRTALSIHSDQRRWIIYESPHSKIKTSLRTHEEEMIIDLRRMKVEWGFLRHIPLRIGSYFKTWGLPDVTWADFFQQNAHYFEFITPKLFDSITVSYKAMSSSYSGRQMGEEWTTLKIENSLGLIDQSMVSLLTIQGSYYRTNESGWWYLVTPDDPLTGLLNISEVHNQGFAWTARKGWLWSCICDTRPLGLPATIKGEITHYWNDDPTQTSLGYNGKSITKYGLFYGNVFDIGQYVDLAGEIGIEKLEDLWGLKAMVTIEFRSRAELELAP